MIVCVCNRLNDSKIKAAIKAGATSAPAVFKQLGVQRACGQCLESVVELLDAAKTEKFTNTAA